MLLEEIIEGCKSGNRKAQEALYRQFSDQLFSICLRYASNQEEAEDILQVGFIRIFRSINHYKGIGSFEGWLIRIMINQAIDQYRKRPKLARIQLDEPEVLKIPAPIGDTFDAESLLQLITRLPEKYRMVFNLYAIEGYTHQEIAVMLDISEGTSKSQLSRARKWLKEKLEGVATNL